jgi:hypothetical protein
MPEYTLLAVAVTPYGVMQIREPVARYRACDRLDFTPPIAQPTRSLVVARWLSTEAGRLEANWLPSDPATL